MTALPKSWNKIPLKDLGRWFGGGTPSKANASFWKDGTIPWVSPKDMKSDRITTAQDFITEQAVLESATNMVEEKSILVVARSGILKHTLPVAITERRVALNQDMKAVKLHEGFEPEYITYALKAFENDILNTCTKSGTTVENIQMPLFLRYEIPVAPLSDQRKIVSEIEKQLTRLDAGVEALKRVQANLKRYKASVLKAAWEGRLVETEAELTRREGRGGYESGKQLLARILKERWEKWDGRGKYKEPIEPDVKNLPKLPEGWIWTTLDALANVKGGVAKDQQKVHASPTRSVPYLRVANVQRGYLNLKEVKEIYATEDDIKELNLESGDLLFNEGGDRDKLGRGWIWNNELPECIHQNHVFRARLFLKEMKPKLISWHSNSFGQKYFFDEGKHTTNLASISMGKLKTLPIPIPPVHEQSRLVSEVERRLSVVSGIEEDISKDLQRALGLKQTILHKAFSGQLVHSGTAKVESQADSNKSTAQRRHFSRALLSAEIVHCLHNEPTFGRTKHQKIFHLCEHIAQIDEIDGQYHREAAGPLDNKLIYGNEGELKKQKWYKVVPRKEFGHQYIPLQNAGNHGSYLNKYWPEKISIIQKLITRMQSWSTERCEIFSTTYAAWNDLILWGKEPTEDAILHEILDRWNESKKRISKDRWQGAIQWIKKEGFSPTGFGNPTAKPESTQQV